MFQTAGVCFSRKKSSMNIFTVILLILFSNMMLPQAEEDSVLHKNGEFALLWNGDSLQAEKGGANLPENGVPYAVLKGQPGLLALGTLDLSGKHGSVLSGGSSVRLKGSASRMSEKKHSGHSDNGLSKLYKYIHSLEKEGGGYGWEDQYDAHLTPTFASVGILFLLDELPGDRQPLCDFFRNGHPQRNPDNREAGNSGTELRNLVYQQVQGLMWLGCSAEAFKQEVLAWDSQEGNNANFERSGYPVFMQEMMAPVVRGLLGLEQDEFIRTYLISRRRDNGSFNNAPAISLTNRDSGNPPAAGSNSNLKAGDQRGNKTVQNGDGTDERTKKTLRNVPIKITGGDGGDGNILNTWWGLYGIYALDGYADLYKVSAGKTDRYEKGSLSAGADGMDMRETDQIESVVNRATDAMGDVSPYARSAYSGDLNPLALKNRTVQWLQKSQRSTGGFSHQPDPQIGTNEEVAYTWAGIKALDLLGAEPLDRGGAILYLLSLQNRDGGFGNRPGLPSTPMASFYALDALYTLGAFSELQRNRTPGIKKAGSVLPGCKNATDIRNSDRIDSSSASRTAGQINVSGSINPDPKVAPDKAAPLRKEYSDGTVPDYSDYNIYTVQFQAPGSGSPQEAVMLAERLNIHLWGAKNAEAAWIEAAQEIADEKNVPVHFFHSNEDYGKHLEVEGMGSFNHLFDPFFPVERAYTSPRWSLRQPYYFTLAEFQEEYAEPLLQDNGGLIWQVSNNEPLTRILLDESVNNGGFSAISTIHFDQNFLFWLPHLYQYRYQLPFVALQDFHGTESWWWTDELMHYRNLYLARAPGYDAMMEAVRENRIVAVRHDALSGHRTRMLGGGPGVQTAIINRTEEWRWWEDESGKLTYPPAAVSLIRPEDSYEKKTPDTGVMIRIRTRHNGKRGVLREPVTELTRLLINGVEVQADYTEESDRRDRLADVYYLYNWIEVEPGLHQVEATLKETHSGQSHVIKIPFLYE